MPGPYINKAVPWANAYYPLNEPEIGSPYTNLDAFPQNKEIPVMFQPITIKGVTFKNRIFVSPMCMYSADNGHLTDFHLVHIGGFATRGVAGIVMEASAVVPEGRITPEDAGLWIDSQIAGFKRVVDFAHSQGCKVGVQIAHAGRKASTLTPWIHGDGNKTYVAETYIAHDDENGWPSEVYGPSAVPFAPVYPMPKPMTEKDIQYVEDAFLDATKRCKAIGFDFIEVHGAHGYLIHEFLSPISNTRTDQYGGSLENRLRYPLRLISKIREAWEGPLFVRISATDWVEGPEKGEDGEWRYWGIQQSQIYCSELEKLGVDLIDVSSSGNYSQMKVGAPVHGNQVPLAEAMKKAAPNTLIGAVGNIRDPILSETYLKDGKADILLLARGLLVNPNWAIDAGIALGVAVKVAAQYERGY